MKQIKMIRFKVRPFTNFQRYLFYFMCKPPLRLAVGNATLTVKQRFKETPVHFHFCRTRLLTLLCGTRIYKSRRSLEICDRL